MRSALLVPGLQIPTILLFNYPIRGIMPTINRPLFFVSNSNEHYEALVQRQTKNDKNHNTSRNYAVIPIGSTVAVQ